MLLQRPGEIVSREELQKKLWPADTFVDFEQGLNNAMKRLRAALDDNAESPHFIETLPASRLSLYRIAERFGDKLQVADAKRNNILGPMLRFSVVRSAWPDCGGGACWWA